MAEILEVENSNKIILFIDEDIPLLKKFGQLLADTFPTYQIMAMTDLKQAKKSLEDKKPQVILSSLNFKNQDTVIPFFQQLRSKESTKTISLIVTGTRAELEKAHIAIHDLNLAQLPKAITIPNLIQTVQAAIKQANSLSADTIHLDAGQHLFHEGDESDALYILKSGELQVYKTQGGKAVELAVINQQQMIGEMALIDHSLRTASIRAVIPSQVLRLHLGDVEKYIEEQPFWMKMLIHTLSNRIKESNQKLLAK